MSQTNNQNIDKDIINEDNNIHTSITVFSTSSVKQLKESDFALDTLEKIALKWDNCLIVLFYGENQESRDMIKIFSIVSQNIAGPVMAACNLISEREVSKAMTDIKTMGNHPLHWVSMRGFPFILVYRGGIPAAFYNGDRSVSAITDWCMTLACESNYYERYNYASSVKVDNKDAYQMAPVSRYPDQKGNNPIKTQSPQYKTPGNIRGYDLNLPVTVEGSQEAANETEYENRTSRQGRSRYNTNTQQSNIQEPNIPQQDDEEDIPDIPIPN